MKKQETLTIGDTINVDIFEPKFGKYPIGRHEGRICKLHMPQGMKYIEYGCTIEAQVMLIEPKCLTVLVGDVIVSAAENNRRADEAVNALKKQAMNNKGHKIRL